MSSNFNPHLTRASNGKPPMDSDAPRFIKLAAGLRQGVPTDIRPADCGAWRELADGLALVAATRGPAGVDDALTALERDHPNLVKAIKAEPRPRKTHYTTAELLSMEFAPPVCVVPGLLYEGLNLLGGRPKLGKSWLALQIALAVSTGGMVFGQTVERGKVLYLALEDNETRLKGRMQTQGWTAAADVDFHVMWPLLAEGGIDELTQVIEAVRYRLVIIDTASRFMGGKIDQMDPGQTNDTFGALQQIGLTYHAAILMLDHHRKPNDLNPDPVDDILGSTGKAAPADAVLGLYRQRGKAEATLMLTGRDLVETNDLALKWDTLTCCWQCVGKAGDVARGTVQDAIIEALRNFGGASTATRLASYLGKKPSNVTTELNELERKGKVKRGTKQGVEVPWSLV